jgi:hypothetical protein
MEQHGEQEHGIENSMKSIVTIEQHGDHGPIQHGI